MHWIYCNTNEIFNKSQDAYIIAKASWWGERGKHAYVIWQFPLFLADIYHVWSKVIHFTYLTVACKKQHTEDVCDEISFLLYLVHIVNVLWDLAEWICTLFKGVEQYKYKITLHVDVPFFIHNYILYVWCSCFLAHLSWKLKWAILIAFCPSSVCL
jgi:hypothetical protein